MRAYAFWNGTTDWSTSDVPVLLNEETTWNRENLSSVSRNILLLFPPRTFKRTIHSIGVGLDLGAQGRSSIEPQTYRAQ